MKKQKEKILPQFVRSGNAKVVLTTKDGQEKEVDVARMVAEAFVPNPDNKPYVSHKNGNRLDNRAENLEWVDARQNLSK